MEAPETIKPISINRKVLLDAQNLKIASKSVSIAGNVKDSDGTGHSIANSGSVSSGQSGMVSSTDKAQNLTGMALSNANSNAGNAGKDAIPFYGAANARFSSTNSQISCINSKVTSVSPLVESMVIPSSTSVGGEPKTGMETVKTVVDSEAAIVESLNSEIASVFVSEVIGPGVGMTGDGLQPLVNVNEVFNAPPNPENVAVTSGNAIGPVDNNLESAVMSASLYRPRHCTGVSLHFCVLRMVVVTASSRVILD